MIKKVYIMDLKRNANHIIPSCCYLQSVAEVYLTCMVPLRVESHRFSFYNSKIVFLGYFTGSFQMCQL
jgi:hypothetical protein